MAAETPSLDLASAILVQTIVIFGYPVTDHSDAGRFFDRWGCRGYRELTWGILQRKLGGLHV